MKCITIAEAAERIGCISVEFLYKLAREEAIPVVRLGRRVLVDEDDVPRIIRQFKVQPKRGEA
jgi:excisionase family DNA binding protein